MQPPRSSAVYRAIELLSHDLNSSLHTIRYCIEKIAVQSGPALNEARKYSDELERQALLCQRIAKTMKVIAQEASQSGVIDSLLMSARLVSRRVLIDIVRRLEIQIEAESEGPSVPPHLLLELTEVLFSHFFTHNPEGRLRISCGLDYLDIVPNPVGRDFPLDSILGPTLKNSLQLDAFKLDRLRITARGADGDETASLDS